MVERSNESSRREKERSKCRVWPDRLLKIPAPFPPPTICPSVHAYTTYTYHRTFAASYEGGRVLPCRRSEKPSPPQRAISRRHVSRLCKLWPRKRDAPPPVCTLATVVHGFQLLSEATGYSGGECLQNKYARLIKRQKERKREREREREKRSLHCRAGQTTAAEQAGNTRAPLDQGKRPVSPS